MYSLYNCLDFLNCWEALGEIKFFRNCENSLKISIQKNEKKIYCSLVERHRFTTLEFCVS